jgi:YYY domain-containing protein
MLAALGLFGLVEAVGLAAAPLAGLVLGRLPGAGLGLSKVLGLLLVTWLTWMLASLHVAAYGVPLIIGVLAGLALAGLLAALRLRSVAGRADPGAKGWSARRAARLALPAGDPVRRRLLLGSEAVFAAGYAVMALFVSFAPDVWGTEKPMDMSFITAINASAHFPPHDPWMSGESLNYYYLGHLAMAWPIKLLGIRPDSGYLLAWALLYALSAAAVFTVGGTVWAAARDTLREHAPRGGPVAAGLLAVALTLVLGNLAGVREWVQSAHPPGDYDWFGVSRVIPGTINEFPTFSFVLGDLHAHVLALPFTLLALAFALQVALAGPRGDLVWRAVAEALAAGLAVGALYAINSWSYPVAAGLVVAGIVTWMRSPASAGRRDYAVAWLVLVLAASVVLLLPFWIDYVPAAEGVGKVTSRRPFDRWLGDQALIYATVAWPLIALYARRLLGSRHPWRWATWGAVGLIAAGSLLAAADLTGAVILAALLAVAVHAALSPRLAAPERFVWILAAGAAVLLLAPELVYVRDAFDHTSLYRMNTVFKLGYQAYLLLAVAAACAIPWAAAWLPRLGWQVWTGVTALLLAMGLVFPYAGSWARTGGFHASPSLDGLGWLRVSAPGDPPAIDWLRAHTPGSAVVLESFGPDYSAFGHARISTFSGRATVLGWAGHELQWEHDPGSRAADVKTLYTTTDLPTARRLLARYGVDYVVVGPLERTDYGSAGLAKWDVLGRRVFDRAGTTIWRVT